MQCRVHSAHAPAAANCELRIANSPDRRKAAGFSLIEVNIAILVIAGGLLSLFALFPAGLRMSSAALSDTRQALFADDFFAYFGDGVMRIDNRDDWQNIETFWEYASDGLKDGFGSKAKLSDADWHPDSAVINKWSVEGKLSESDFTKGDLNRLKPEALFLDSNVQFLRFRHGKVEDYFTGNTPSDKLDAEFIVRIASDTEIKDAETGDVIRRADNLIWRVSLIVSDDGPGGWYYDNPVYHRDFRYAELP